MLTTSYSNSYDNHIAPNHGHGCYVFITSMVNLIVNHPKNHQKCAVETKGGGLSLGVSGV